MSASLAERLGFSATDRVAIVHADDIGMCHAANEGAFEALEHGPATCGSLMVPCPWFPEAVELARIHPELDLGIHLTLNSEFEHYRWGPVAGRRAVPSLLDDKGYLPRTTAEVLQRAKPEEVEIELRAQIQMALDAGIDVTHLDGHMGTVFLPPFNEVYKKLALEFQLPAFAARPTDAALEAVGLPGSVGAMLRAFADEVEAEGFPVVDGFDAISLEFEPGQGKSHNEKRIDALPIGISYLICHPARDGEELFFITPETAHQRDFERQFYGGDDGFAAFADRGIQLLGMRSLRELVQDG